MLVLQERLRLSVLLLTADGRIFGHDIYSIDRCPAELNMMQLVASLDGGAKRFSRQANPERVYYHDKYGINRYLRYRCDSQQSWCCPC